MVSKHDPDAKAKERASHAAQRITTGKQPARCQDRIDELGERSGVSRSQGEDASRSCPRQRAARLAAQDRLRRRSLSRRSGRRRRRPERSAALGPVHTAERLGRDQVASSRRTGRRTLDGASFEVMESGSSPPPQPSPVEGVSIYSLQGLLRAQNVMPAKAGIQASGDAAACGGQEALPRNPRPHPGIPRPRMCWIKPWCPPGLDSRSSLE